MTLVTSVDKVVEWLNRVVCSQITLKVPDDYRNDSEYNVKYVNPRAFPLYFPSKEHLPPSIPAPIPSICVQLTEGSDDLLKKQRQLQVRLCLACWNPGEHGHELFIPRKNPAALGGIGYFHPTGEAAEKYTRNMDGWRDLYNFLDLTLTQLEDTEYIEGHRIVKEAGIKYGPFTEDGEIVSYYPYWHHWITFTLEVGVVAKTPETYKELL